MPIDNQIASRHWRSRRAIPTTFRADPDWGGNYAVQFWDPQWQSIVLDYADKIVAAGFDGVYLDKVDEFEDMGHRDEMVELVRRIAARVKARQPGFLVISQNGDALLPDKKFRDAIDEETLAKLSSPTTNSPSRAPKHRRRGQQERPWRNKASYRTPGWPRYAAA